MLPSVKSRERQSRSDSRFAALAITWNSLVIAVPMIRCFELYMISSIGSAGPASRS